MESRSNSGEPGPSRESGWEKATGKGRKSRNRGKREKKAAGREKEASLRLGTTTTTWKEVEKKKKTGGWYQEFSGEDPSRKGCPRLGKGNSTTVRGVGPRAEEARRQGDAMMSNGIKRDRIYPKILRR